MEEKKFDANSIIGFILLGAIMFWFMYTNPPEEQATEEQATEKQTNAPAFQEAKTKTLTQEAVSDSLAYAQAQQRLGNFAYSASLNVSETGTTVLENEVLKLTFSNKGAQITEALVKNYKTYNALPLYIIKDANASFNINFGTTSNRILNTKDLVFQPVLTQNGDNSILSMKLKVSEHEYLEYRYELKPDEYMIGFAVQSIGLNTVINSSNAITLDFDLKAYRHEKSMKYENQMSALYYEKEDGKIDDLSISGSDAEEETDVNWVGFKQHFFSTVLNSSTPFKTAKLSSETLFEDETIDSVFTKGYSLQAPLALNNGELNYNFDLFIGPNDYELLASYDKQLENIVDLGWGIFGWINRHAFIPLFAFLGGFISNYGLIIILMTIVVRIFMSPLVYKSYLIKCKNEGFKTRNDGYQ